MDQSNIINMLREELKENASEENRTCYVKVMGYEKIGLCVKYRQPESAKDLMQIGEKNRKGGDDKFTQNLHTAMDTMAFLCEGLYVELPDEVEGKVELDPEQLGEPVRFDQRLAETIGMNGDSPSARAVIKKLFDGNDLAIMSHAEKLSRWLVNSKADVDADFWQLGE